MMSIALLFWRAVGRFVGDCGVCGPADDISSARSCLGAGSKPIFAPLLNPLVLLGASNLWGALKTHRANRTIAVGDLALRRLAFSEKTRHGGLVHTTPQHRRPDRNTGRRRARGRRRPARQ